MGGKHSAYERDTFRYPLVQGATPQDTQLMLGLTRRLVHQASEQTDAVARLLQKAVQETAGVGLARGEDDQGRMTLKRREVVKATDFAFGRDILAAYWQEVGEELKVWMQRLSQAATTDDELRDAQDQLLAQWAQTLVYTARRLYAPHFDRYSTQPPTMPYAYRARRFFLSNLAKQTGALGKPDVSDGQPPQTATAQTARDLT